MDNYANANGGAGNGNRDGDGHQNHQPQHFLQYPLRPRNIMFTMTRRQLALIYITWVAARMRVRQQVYEPALPLPPNPPPPIWSDELRTMIVLWIARERRMFEMEVRELEYLLGLREYRF
ncbi:uncharacterized protein F5891DRAFT_983516 [Suillus fuscotomentosus]|uniref:Uncharacterized protein n=1 Tax=Suillus fuscotomentosus TaxID=1912939 RepID=A0AAD4E126_9AGAM|nr:uncharacterized protein F5891DRAFT_983516 [Suillus fuscotomentosus]KAG1896328.1 hypothetical protein F5891DRAFT_983516 [Suillus fuscotomentosus]